jgi:hypothetical protein
MQIATLKRAKLQNLSIFLKLTIFIVISQRKLIVNKEKQITFKILKVTTKEKRYKERQKCRQVPLQRKTSKFEHFLN